MNQIIGCALFLLCFNISLCAQNWSPYEDTDTDIDSDRSRNEIALEGGFGMSASGDWMYSCALYYSRLIDRNFLMRTGITSPMMGVGDKNLWAIPLHVGVRKEFLDYVNISDCEMQLIGGLSYGKINPYYSPGPSMLGYYVATSKVLTIDAEYRAVFYDLDEAGICSMSLSASYLLTKNYISYKDASQRPTLFFRISFGLFLRFL